jgi:poly-gamma-glutamate capsule biosynthesis protein CapA/YwtB (metallophosphatase superfamily)
VNFRSIVYFFFLLFYASCASVNNDNATAAKRPETGTVEILLAGDLMLDWGIKDTIKAKDPEYPVKNLNEFLSNFDYRFCNLECPVSETGDARPDKKYVFLGDPEHLEMLKYAGINGVSLANNHSNDFGQSALLDTIHNLERYGIDSAGAGKDLRTARLPLTVNVKNIKIAIGTYTELAYDDSFAGEDYPGVARADIESIISDIKQFKAYHDFFIVSIHWGDEYSEFPNREQTELARLLIDNGADAVIGHHPHIYQGVEIYKNKPIFYSLGNFIFGSINEDIKENILAQISFAKNKINSFHIYSINSNKSGNPFQYNILNDAESRSVFDHLIQISRHLGKDFAEKAKIEKNSLVYFF